MTALGLMLRAVSGSGKSTLTRSILAWAQDEGISCTTLSTDDLFITQGVYRFDPSLLESNHAQTVERFRHQLSTGTQLVVIDNTNLHPEALVPYHQVALQSGIRMHLVELLPNSFEYHCKANVHGVPEVAIEAQFHAFEEHRAACHSLFPAPPMSLPSPPTEADQIRLQQMLASWLT